MFRLVCVIKYYVHRQFRNFYCIYKKFELF